MPLTQKQITNMSQQERIRAFKQAYTTGRDALLDAGRLYVAMKREDPDVSARLIADCGVDLTILTRLEAVAEERLLPEFAISDTAVAKRCIGTAVRMHDQNRLRAGGVPLVSFNAAGEERIERRVSDELNPDQARLLIRPDGKIRTVEEQREWLKDQNNLRMARERRYTVNADRQTVSFTKNNELDLDTLLSVVVALKPSVKQIVKLLDDLGITDSDLRRSRL